MTFAGRFDDVNLEPCGPCALCVACRRRRDTPSQCIYGGPFIGFAYDITHPNQLEDYHNRHQENLPALAVRPSGPPVDQPA